MLASKANVIASSLLKLFEGKLSEQHIFWLREDAMYLVHSVLLIAEIPVATLDQARRSTVEQERRILAAHLMLREDLRLQVCDLAREWLDL